MLGRPGSAARYRVLFVNDTARNGGPGRSLCTILTFVDPRVIHRSVVLPRAGAVSELLTRGDAVDELHFEPNLVENVVAPLSRELQRDDLAAALPVRASRAVANAGRAAHGLWRLDRLIRRGRYDLIYCNGTTADFVGGALAWATGVPALWHVRYTALPPLLEPVHRRLSAGPGVARILCVSQAAAALFEHCRDKVRVVHNAVDLAQFSAAVERDRLRAELGVGGDTVIFGSHGRVLRRKGFLEMIEAAHRLRSLLDRREWARCRFVVVGDTPADFAPDHVAECRAAAARLGLGDAFHFTGFRDDVRPLVADFDVAVVPSVYPDPLPRAVIEAMALGKPVLAFAVGGITEMVETGRTGTLLRGTPPDIEGLAVAMRDYARDPARRITEGAAARQRIEQQFDAARHGRTIESEIVNVIETTRARREHVGIPTQDRRIRGAR
jgi:glycosyltransferase involved in cell wall biosynthesis